MSRSALTSIYPKSVYKLSDVFEAVTQDQAANTHLQAKSTQWAKDIYLNGAEAGYTSILKQLEEWQAQGVELIVADAPFAETYHIGAPVEHSLFSQFKNGQVRPLHGPDVI